MRYPTTFRRAAAGALLAALAGAAEAQDKEKEGPPSPEEVRKKVIEIERLMRGAEDSLVRTLDSSSAEAKARRAAKLLDEKAKQQTGKSAEELRKLAESGSKEATETLKKLTEEANRKVAESAEGVRKLLEETKSGSGGATRGIQWVLDKAVRQGPGPSEQKPEGEQPTKGGDGKKPVNPDEKKEPQDREKTKDPPPESPREKPRNPKMEKWLADLPPQVRKMYEAQDWDSIPPRYKDLIRAWSKMMAEDLEKERK